MKKRNHTSHHPKGYSRRNIVIVLEEVNFIWDRSELKEIVQMWKKGISLWEMGEYFGRDPDEVMLACIHLAKEKRIQYRRMHI
ncbi:helix-turn-helix domain containing protein [Niallia sp. NCCP-28]|uniref:helix-turn-helix domain containing protein n=1 Tax=Niallia sp. NCCP-28 TaxID=2934712 RepID=UPI00207FBE84|nr:helix-turn-helix domain containing protein [Niallia sp. NCCP-28]GKU81227.1 hypothetical protein NCCP28_06230 [Niallia sp. NCCP-28]